MVERFKFISAAYLVLVRDGKVLLARRCNTGYMDGCYSVPAGHLDGNETARQALARELREEIGITVRPEDLRVAHVMHRHCGGEKERIEFFMTTDSYEGEIVNTEPEKCDDLAWFPLDALPENTIDHVRTAIGLVQAGVTYSEFGW